MRITRTGRATALGMSLLIVSAGVAVAADLKVDASLATGQQTSVSLGSALVGGTSGSHNVLVYVQGGGPVTYPLNFTFDGSTDIVTTATGGSISAAGIDNGTNSSVSYTLPCTLGPVSGTVTFRGPTALDAETATATLTGTIASLDASCSPPPPADTTAPQVSISLDPSSPDGSNGWYVSGVEVTVTATDASGIASVEYSLDGGAWQAYSAPFTVSADGQHTVDARATDSSTNANVGYADQVSFKIDQTDPTVTCDAASFLLNQSPANVTASVSDVTSGAASSPVSAAADTSSVGQGKTVSITGYDNAGNSTTKSCSYSVSYAFNGFFSPVDNDGILNVVKAGQTVPLKWRLTDAAGTPVLNLSGVSVTAANLSCSVGTSADLLEEVASGSSGLQNLGDGYYQFNWKSPTSYAKSCKTLTVNLGGGGSPTALFQFNR